MYKYYVNIFVKIFYRDIEFMLFVNFFLPTFKACFILLYEKKKIYIYIFNSVLEESKYKNKYLLFVCIKG